MFWKTFIQKLQANWLESPPDTIESVPDAELQRLMSILEEEGRRQRRRTKAALRAVYWILGVVGLFAIGVTVAAATTGNWWLMSGLGVCGFAGFAGFLSFFTLASKRHKDAAKIVARCNDPRAIGPLADSLAINDARIISSVYAALAKLLPQMDESIAQTLGPERVEAINRVLKGGYWQVVTPWQGNSPSNSVNGFVFGFVHGWRERQQQLIAAIIAASPLFGNSETLKLVRRYAEPHRVRLPSVTLGNENQAIVESAKVALPGLEARIERLKKGDILLRPAEFTQPDSLLRPAASSERNDEHVLLRPGNL